MNKKNIFIILGILTILIGLRLLNVQEYFKAALEHIETLGSTGYFIFIGLYVAACVFFVPGSVLTLGAGALYGVVKGSILVSVASTLGAAVAFLVGRYLARGWVESKIEGNQKFGAIDKAVSSEGWKIVLLTRLSPVFPFNLLNYAYGLTPVSFGQYVLSSWIGMMPGTVMYVYLGSIANQLANSGSENGSTSLAQWILYGVGLVATIVVTVIVTKIAKQALSQKIEGRE